MNNSYEYGAALFNSRRQAIIAMCEDWLTAQGLNDWDSDTVQEALANPAKAAAEMTVADWDTVAIVGRRDDDGEQVYETIPTADLRDALEEIAQTQLLSTEPQRLTTTIDQHRGVHPATGMVERAYAEVVTDWRDIGNGEPFTSDAATMVQACHKAEVAIASLTPRGRELAGQYIADGDPSDLEETIRLMEQAAWRYDGDDPDNPNPDDQF